MYLTILLISAAVVVISVCTLVWVLMEDTE